MSNKVATLPEAIVTRDRRIAELELQLRQREAELQQLRQRLAELEQRLAEQERAGKRQATPFARKKRKAKPKHPGRKAGQGKFTYRTPPTPEEVNETKEAPLECCPQCRGMLTDFKAHEQFVVDIPEVRPLTTRYVTHSGYCGAHLPGTAVLGAASGYVRATRSRFRRRPARRG